ncbi:MAG: hypothetical protein E7616_05440 [Ruminococcaceae bacterium]|nr:hypothetical protein [Oscillospiraceae bacterium]
MKMLNKLKYLTALCLLFALLLSSCGGAMPENTPPSAQTPEVQTPSVEIPTANDPTPAETADPDETKKNVYDYFKNRSLEYFTDCAVESYLSPALMEEHFDSLENGKYVTMESVEELFGKPHYKIQINAYYEIIYYVYILSDSRVLEIKFGGFETVEKLYTGDFDAYIENVKQTWNPQELEVRDPQTVYDALHEMLQLCNYMHYSDRIDYPRYEDAFKIDTRVPNIRITLEDDIIPVLGQPHFTYSSQECLPSGVGFDEYHFYILDNGIVIMTYGSSLASYLEKDDVDMRDMDSALSVIDLMCKRKAVDPSQTYAMLYEELSTHQYIHITERKDYPDKAAMDILRYGATKEKIEELLGQPHFIQIEEQKKPGDSILREYRFYILSDGRVYFTRRNIDEPDYSYTHCYNADAILKAIDSYLYY